MAKKVVQRSARSAFVSLFRVTKSKWGTTLVQHWSALAANAMVKITHELLAPSSQLGAAYFQFPVTDVTITQNLNKSLGKSASEQRKKTPSNSAVHCPLNVCAPNKDQ